jgi:hypothetical protein
VALLEDLRPLAGAGAAIVRAGAVLAARLVDASTAAEVVGALGTRRPEEPPVDDPLGRLLQRASTQSSADAVRSLHEAAVSALVPDEARIVASLAARGWSPVVHVESRREDELHLGLRNASLIGRQAGVALAARTPLYVTRLLHVGLVDLTAERPGHADEYEVLLAEPHVLDAVRRAGRGPLGARIRRHGIVLSDLGAEIWASREVVGAG